MIEDKLEGTSLKERHKSLNKLISNVTVEEYTAEYIGNLLSKSRLDKIFLAGLANRFKDSSVVCELLKSEDEIVVSKILKCKWFFEGSHNTDVLNSIFFFKNVFPFVTYVTKCKIFSKLGIHLKDQKLAEDFYKNISEKYGRESAVKVLPACSEQFILQELNVKGFKIPNLQTKYIYRKYPILIKQYLKDGIKNDSVNNYSIDVEMLLDLIALDCPMDFIHIIDSNKSYQFMLGYRTTSILLEHNKKFVIDNASRLYERLNVEALLKKLMSDDRDQYLMQLMPSKIEDFMYVEKLEDIFKHFKPEYRALYLIKLCKKKYENTNIIQSDKIPESLAEHLPIDLRVEWAKFQLSRKGSNEVDFLKYMPITDAIKRLMELTNSASNIEKRSAILYSMVDCCKINNDTVELLNVMKYVAKRHRNDQEQLKINFLERVKSSFELYRLSSEHWEVIDEMVNIMIFNNEITKYFHRPFFTSVLENSIHFRILNNLEFETIIDIMMKYQVNQLNLLTDFPEYEEMILMRFFNKYRLLIENQPLIDDFEETLVMVLRAFYELNDKTKKNRSLNDHPWLLDAIRLWFKNQGEKNVTYSSLLYFLANNRETKLMFYDEIFKRKFNEELFQNALIHNPKIVFDNIDLVIESTAKSYFINPYVRAYGLIQSYLNRPLGITMKQELVKNIENYQEERTEHFSKLIMALSLLVDVPEIESILKTYLPSVSKIVVSDDPEVRIEYKRTQTLLENLKYINPPPSYDTALAFGKDDYFKFILPSILSMCFRKPENSTVEFIRALSKQPVSVKKHSIRLSYFLLPKQEILSMYKAMWEVDKNSSIRDVLFQRTFRIFEKETDLTIASDAFKMFKEFVQSFQERDRNLFEYLEAVHRVREEFLSEYCEVSWSTLKRLEKLEIDVRNVQSNLISRATGVIKVLSHEFCETIINEYLCLLNELDIDSYSSLENFCVVYLVSAESVETQNKHVSNFCGNFKPFMHQKWDVTKYRMGIINFLNRFCLQSMTYYFRINPSGLLTSLYEMIKSVLPFEALPGVTLNYIIGISFLELLTQPLKIESLEITANLIGFLLNFSKKLIGIFDNFVATYGVEAIGYFSVALNNILSPYSSENDLFLLNFLEQLLETGGESRHLTLLIVDLLPGTPGDNPKSKDIHAKIINKISLFNDLFVKIKLGEKFTMPLAYFSA